MQSQTQHNLTVLNLSSTIQIQNKNTKELVHLFFAVLRQRGLWIVFHILKLLKYTSTDTFHLNSYITDHMIALSLKAHLN